MKYEARVIYADGRVATRTCADLHRAEAWVARQMQRASAVSYFTPSPGRRHLYPSNAVTLATVTEK